MPEGFSFNREFDFVRLDGLRRATGRPPHEWDIYIIKELIDNALDADDGLWGGDPTTSPRIEVLIEYVDLPERFSRQLFIHVGNRAKFPTHLIKDIFATQWYTSRKAFIKGLTRGALGNALKTLLGIPYALRNRVAGDWAPDLKPLSLLCGHKEYLPRFIVDSTAQTINVECEEKESKYTEGTVVRVGLDHFSQEMPRALHDIKQLAEQYKLCNPHASFNWKVEIDGQEWEKEYPPDSSWAGKFQGEAPVHWYSPTDFQDLLGALYRNHCGDKKDFKLPLKDIISKFAGLEERSFSGREQSNTFKPIGCFAQQGVTAKDIESPAVNQLYRALCEHTPAFDSLQLGALGPQHIKRVLAQALPLASEVLYQSVTDAGADPHVPFVIEAAVASLKEGKRQMWTAINYAPSYGDPFHSRWLKVAGRPPDEPVLGLRGLLDSYEIYDDTPIIVFLHLICPNVEHHEFSKTEIDHLPFREELSLLIDRLLTSFRQKREEEELRLEQTIFRAIDSILGELGEDERFVYDQLLERIRIKLSLEQALAAWLEKPEAQDRLQTYINNYQQRNNTVLTHRVARPAAGTLSIPLHPDRHFSVLAEHLSKGLLVQHHVNKLLFVRVREFEPVVIDNGWLCTMDMALLHNLSSREGLRDALVQCVVSTGLPVLMLHDADEASRAIVDEAREWLRERQLDPDRIVDLGLTSPAGPGDAHHPLKLAQMMPNELASWLRTRFSQLAISQKSMPLHSDIRQNIRERFEQLLLGHLWEGMSHQFEVTNLLDAINSRLHFTDTMIERALDNQIKKRLAADVATESYHDVLDEVVKEFFVNFMRENSGDIQSLVETHMEHLYSKQKNGTR